VRHFRHTRGGGKAVESVKSLCATFRFKVVAEPVLVQNRPDKAAVAQLKALGKTLRRRAGNRGTRVRVPRLPRPPASAAIGTGLDLRPSG